MKINMSVRDEIWKSLQKKNLDGGDVHTLINDLYTKVTGVNDIVTNHTTSISNINDDISLANKNISSLSTTVANHTTSISTNATNISSANKNISSLSSTVANHTTSINTNATNISKKANTSDLANYIRLNGANATINPVADLNSFYNGIGLFNTPANGPISGWTWCVSVGISGTICQLAGDLWTVNNRIYKRCCAAGTWSAWSSVIDYDSASITTLNSTTVSCNTVNSNGIIYSRYISSTEYAQNNDNCIVNFVNRQNNAYVPIRALMLNSMSSRLTKENIIPISSDEAKKILDIIPVNFDFKKEFGGYKNNVGVIAEDTYKVLPKVVTMPEDYDEEEYIKCDHIDKDKVPSVDYTKFIPYMIKLIQEQQKEIDNLKSIIGGDNNET